MTPEKPKVGRGSEVTREAGARKSTIHISPGMALFSTNFGERLPRFDISSGLPMILRSAPALEAQQAAEHYRKLYPKQCRNILHDFALKDWFDGQDIHVQGREFLRNVLFNIATKNTKDMDQFNVQWSLENRSRLEELCGPVTLSQVFSDTERDEYGDVFLDCALVRIRHALFQLSQIQGKIPTRPQSVDEEALKSTEEQEPSRPFDRAASTPAKDKQAVTEETRTRSDAEATPDTDPTTAEEKIPRRSSFNDILAIPKEEHPISRAQVVATEALASQPHKTNVSQSSEHYRNANRREHPVLPRLAPMDLIPRTASVAPTMRHHSSRLLDNPVHQYSPRSKSQERRPSLNLRMQVMEGTEQPKGFPSYHSLNEVVNQQPPAFTQFPQAGLQNTPFFYTIEGQFVLPTEPSPHPTFRPSQYELNSYVRSPPIAQPTNQQMQSQQMAATPNPAPLRSYNDQYVPERWQDQHFYNNERPRLYDSNSLPIVRQNKGIKRDKLPNRWSGRRSSQEHPPNSARCGPGNSQFAVVAHLAASHDQVGFRRQENAPPQQPYRTRADSIEPFPPFHDSGLPQVPYSTDPQFSGQVSMEDFICTAHRIGRLREDVRSLWVSQFPSGTDELLLERIFGQVAHVRTVHVRPGSRFTIRPFAFVDFVNSNETKKALAAFNEGRLRLPFQIDVRVPEQNYNSDHYYYIAPEAAAAQYLSYLSGERHSLPQSGRELRDRRPSNPFQHGRDFSHRRSSGPSGRRQSFSRQPRAEEQKLREPNRQNSSQDVRSGFVHRPSQTAQNRSSIVENVMEEGGYSNNASAHRQRQKGGSVKSSGNNTPKKRRGGQVESEGVSEYQPKVPRKETSMSSSDQKRTDHRTKRQDGSAEHVKFGVATGSVSRTEEGALRARKHTEPDRKTPETETEKELLGAVLVERAGPDSTAKAEEKNTTQLSPDKLTSKGQLVGSTNESRREAEFESTSTYRPRSSTSAIDKSREMVVPERGASKPSEVHHHKTQEQDAKFAVAASKVDEPIGVTRKNHSRDPNPTEIEERVTAVEVSNKPAKDYRGRPEKTVVPEQERLTEANTASQEGKTASFSASTVPPPKGSSSTHRHGPAQTESLSPFGRRKPPKLLPKKEGKKKQKSKGKAKMKDELSAPNEGQDVTQFLSARGSRAVSSESFHTADEPESDRFEDGKSDATVQDDSYNSSYDSEHCVDAEKSAVQVAEPLDDHLALESIKPYDSTQTTTEIKPSLALIAEQQDNLAPVVSTNAPSITKTNDVAVSHFGSLKEQSMKTSEQQDTPTSTAVEEDAPKALLHDVADVGNDKSQQILRQSTDAEPISNSDSPLEAGAVTITALSSRRSFSKSPSKRRPARLELSDITNIPFTTAKAPAKETALNTLSHSPKPDPLVVGSGTDEMATTPTKRKRKNNHKKKKRASQGSATGKSEDSPESAQYVTSATTYPPLHHAASTTVVGLCSASATQNSHSKDDVERQSTFERDKGPTSAQRAHSHDALKVAGDQDKRGKDHEQPVENTLALYEPSNLDNGKNMDVKDQKETSSDQERASGVGARLSPTDLESIQVLAKEEGSKSPRMNEEDTEDPLSPEDTEITDKNVTFQKKSNSRQEKKAIAQKSAAGNPWAVNRTVSKVPFREIQAADAAKKEKAKAEKAKTQEQRGEASVKEAVTEDRPEARTKTMEDTGSTKWTKAGKGKALIEEATDQQQLEAKAEGSEETEKGGEIGMEKQERTLEISQSKTENENETSTAESLSGADAKLETMPSLKPPLWSQIAQSKR